MSQSALASTERTHTRRRPRQFIVWTVLVVLLVGAVVFAVYRSQTLHRRAQLLSVGMSRAQIEEILGAPYLELRKGVGAAGGRLVWTDMFWQVDVVIDEDQLLESYCVPANSSYRRIQAKLFK